MLLRVIEKQVVGPGIVLEPFILLGGRDNRFGRHIEQRAQGGSLPQQPQVGPECGLLLENRGGVNHGLLQKFLRRRGDRPGVDDLIAVLGLELSGVEVKKICTSIGDVRESVNGARACFFFFGGTFDLFYAFTRASLRLDRWFLRLVHVGARVCLLSLQPCFPVRADGRSPRQRFHRYGAPATACPTRRPVYCAGTRWWNSG